MRQPSDSSYELETGSNHELCRAQPMVGDQPDRLIDIRTADEHRAARSLPRPEPQPGGGDDPERAFAPDEQPRQVVPGRVLGQSSQPRHHRAIGEHRLDAEDLAACVAVAADPHAARVGADRAADRGAVARGEVDPVRETGLAGGLLDRGDRRARTGRELAVVHIADIAESASRQNHRSLAIRSWDAASHEAGVAALRHDRHARLSTCSYDGRHLIGVCRADNSSRPAGEPPGPVGLVRARQLGIGEDVGTAYDVAQACLEGHGSTLTHSPARTFSPS